VAKVLLTALWLNNIPVIISKKAVLRGGFFHVFFFISIGHRIDSTAAIRGKELFFVSLCHVTPPDNCLRIDVVAFVNGDSTAIYSSGFS
jgi:hypothetical protein